MIRPLSSPDDTLKITYADLPGLRDTRPTAPQDLRDYAWKHTGPHVDGELDDISAGSLLNVSQSNVPRVLVSAADLAALQLDHREGFLVSLLDGETALETVLDVCGMAEGDALLLLCDLSARGIIAFN